MLQKSSLQTGGYETLVYSCKKATTEITIQYDRPICTIIMKKHIFSHRFKQLIPMRLLLIPIKYFSVAKVQKE